VPGDFGASVDGQEAHRRMDRINRRGVSKDWFMAPGKHPFIGTSGAWFLSQFRHFSRNSPAPQGYRHGQ
jgi:hypothetical protein